MRILDATCGKRLMWFDRNNPNTVYVDIRPEVHPDIVCDSTKLPFRDQSFDLVVFDPPHTKLGPNSQMADRYGIFRAWEIRKLVHEGFTEFSRVLRDEGIVMFKWSTHNVKLETVLASIPRCFTPLLGQRVSIRTKSSSMTYWVCLVKS